MAETANFQMIANLYSAYERGDLEAFYKDLSPDISWKECDGFPTPGVFRSQTEIVEKVFSVLQKDWVNWRFELERLIDGNQDIVALGTYRGTHGITGKSFEARASHAWKLVDGKILGFEQFADTHMMQSAASGPAIST